MYINMKVFNKVLVVLGVVCLSIAVYLACGLRLDAFREAVPLLIAPTFVAVKTRTAIIITIVCALAAAGVIAAALLRDLPA